MNEIEKVKQEKITIFFIVLFIIWADQYSVFDFCCLKSSLFFKQTHISSVFAIIEILHSVSTRQLALEPGFHVTIETAFCISHVLIESAG